MPEDGRQAAIRVSGAAAAPRPGPAVGPGPAGRQCGRPPPAGPVHWAQRKAWMGRVAPHAVESDPGTVEARGRARCEDHPGAAGRTPAGHRRPRAS